MSRIVVWLLAGMLFGLALKSPTMPKWVNIVNQTRYPSLVQVDGARIILMSGQRVRFPLRGEETEVRVFYRCTYTLRVRTGFTRPRGLLQVPGGGILWIRKGKDLPPRMDLSLPPV